MSGGLDNLKLDTWYKALIAAGLLALLVSIATGKETFVALSLGIFMIGVGEWINHPTRTAFVDREDGFPSQGILTIKTRRPSLLGWTVDCLGVIFFAVGIYRLLRF
jgi:hypothetical protein